MVHAPMTDADRRLITKMWTAEHAIDDICRILHRNHSSVEWAAKAMGLGPKPRKTRSEIWDQPGLTDALREKWMSGKSAMETAKELSAEFQISITRNAAIGKIHRMGIARSPDVARENERVSGLLMQRASAFNVKAPKVKKERSEKTAVHNPDALKGQTREPWVIITDAAWDILPGSEPKNLINRRSFGECKYPVGVDEPEQRFCCIRTAQTYCDTHRAVMFRPFTRDERRIERLYCR